MQSNGNNFAQSPKAIIDPIYNRKIELPPLCVSIIDTPQFQRLREIKQLGFCHYIYPTADHCRFEHCLGVCHLAGEMVKTLVDLKSEEEARFFVDERDILAVQIAALCHDLGHGPFSHFWERFLEKAKPNNQIHWRHEDMSVKMLDHLIEDNNLLDQFEYYFGEKYEMYLMLIKEQINGTEATRIQLPWIIDGHDKNFLYEIVANKLSGIDVDKFDYLARDSYYLGIKIGFDHTHIMQCARVCTSQEDRKLHVCFRDKEKSHFEEMFRSRWNLHKVGYQHRVARVIEEMMMDILLAADKANPIPIFKGLSLYQASLEPETFALLTDEILCFIRLSENPLLNEARSLLQRIERRNFYKFIGKAFIRENDLAQQIKENPEKFSLEIWNRMKEEMKSQLKAEDIVINLQVFTTGNDVQNPLRGLYFYAKRDKNVGRTSREPLVAHLHLSKYHQTFLLCFSKSPSVPQAVKTAFNTWCQNYELEVEYEDSNHATQF